MPVIETRSGRATRIAPDSPGVTDCAELETVSVPIPAGRLPTGGSDALPAAQSGGLIGSMETRAGERMQGRLALLNPARRESSALGSERPRVLRVRGTGHLSTRVPAAPSL